MLFISALVTIITLCLSVGIYMIITSTIMAILELPAICSLVEIARPFVARTEKVTAGWRAVYYSLCVALHLSRFQKARAAPSPFPSLHH